MKKVVVSFADGAGNYSKAIDRLEHSLRQVDFDGEFKKYTDYKQINSPTHKGQNDSVPYAFKAYSIAKAAQEMNWEGLLLWCDSPVYATKSLEPIFNQIAQDGYLFFDNVGYSIGDYTSDACLDKFDMTRQEAFDSKMIAACCMGFDLQNKHTQEFLNEYISAASDGVSYHGAWDNKDLQVSKDMRVKGTRHDQSVASILIKKMKLNITHGQSTYFAYVAHKGLIPVSDEVGLWSEGM